MNKDDKQKVLKAMEFVDIGNYHYTCTALNANGLSSHRFKDFFDIHTNNMVNPTSSSGFDYGWYGSPGIRKHQNQRLTALALFMVAEGDL